MLDIWTRGFHVVTHFISGYWSFQERNSCIKPQTYIITRSGVVHIYVSTKQINTFKDSHIWWQCSPKIEQNLLKHFISIGNKVWKHDIISHIFYFYKYYLVISTLYEQVIVHTLARSILIFARYFVWPLSEWKIDIIISVIFHISIELVRLFWLDLSLYTIPYIPVPSPPH